MPEDRCEECRESYAYGVTPTKCHLTIQGHCHAGPCDHGVVGILPDLEGWELIQVGGSIYQFDRVLDINITPTLTFVYIGTAPSQE